jgi:hypothetical protein
MRSPTTATCGSALLPVAEPASLASDRMHSLPLRARTQRKHRAARRGQPEEMRGLKEEMRGLKEEMRGLLAADSYARG